MTTPPAFGLSQLAPFIRGEEPRERHRRRYAVAVEHLASVAAWCEHRGVEFRHTDDPNYPAFAWKFRTPDRFAVWLPFFARVSYKVGLRRPAHPDRVKVYDAEQLLAFLAWWAEA